MKRINIVSSACAALFIIFALLARNSAVRDWNEALSSWVQSFETPAATTCMKVFSLLGDWIIIVPVLIFLLALPSTRRTFGFPCAAAIVLSVVLNASLKQLFAMPRPDMNQMIPVFSYSFPSGHAMNGTVFTGMLTILLMRRIHDKQMMRTALAVTASLFLLAVGISRVYLGAHYPIDVLAGYCAGGALLAVMLPIPDEQ